MALPPENEKQPASGSGHEIRQLSVSSSSSDETAAEGQGSKFSTAGGRYHSRPSRLDDIEDVDDTALGRLASNPTRVRTRSRSRSNLPPPPDGGLQAWLQVVAGWLVIFATWGYLNSFGAFQSYYTSGGLPSASPSTISWIGSLQGFLTTALGTFSGRLLDAGFFRPTFAVGAALQLAGIFAMSASDNPQYWQLVITQGILTGIGGGILFTPTLGLVATWFGRRRGFAIGLATLGNSTGGILYPVIVRQLLPKIGFAWTARVLGLVNLICYAVALLLMKSRLPPRRSGALVDWSAFKEPVYVLYIVGMFLFVWASYYLFYYQLLTSSRVASFGIQVLGLSYSEASFLIMVINGAGLPARVLMPMLADKIGALNVITMCTLSISVIVFCWFAVSNVPGFYVFTAFCGLVSGATQSLMPTTIASITKRLDMVGTRMGMCFSIISFASLTGPPIGGALQSAMKGSFTGAQVWAAVSTLGAGLCLLGARFYQAQGKIKVKC
ncbi:unnamed protein product [Clonostachys rhizophaga]|uniref:Major facilitator superfamily (MFS) profile domain-containing protein n=1 Tax=Clonostachys rhizophaga TaxID=160324 RepID=A0A9N9VZ09_9HYPO|nr:unnamed protein product [Clonostachys rhizophaga]